MRTFAAERGARRLASQQQFSFEYIMRHWPLLFLAATTCRATPAPAPLQFSSARGALRVWAVDSLSRSPITALSGELRIGNQATFAPERPIADTLLFRHVPTGDYTIAIRRIGYETRILPVHISADANDFLRASLQARPLVSGDVWPQAPWWKFWRR